jgi:hypothetical protein
MTNESVDSGASAGERDNLGGDGVVDNFAPSARDWTEDFAHENGNYMCRCCVCKRLFAGHKRRVVCKVCATTAAPAKVVPADRSARKDQPNAVSAPVAGVELSDEQIRSELMHSLNATMNRHRFEWHHGRNWPGTWAFADELLPTVRAILASSAPRPMAAQKEPQPVPDEVMQALDRMCTPLHESWRPLGIGSATADADARCMKVIREYILGAAPSAGKPAPSAPEGGEPK